MIPRTLVPLKLRPVRPDEVKTQGHRLETYMDDRTVVPSGLSDAPPLDGKTNIPAHLPLGVLVDRTLVPRGMPAVPIERFQPIYESVPIAVLDSRVVVPAYVEPADAEERLEFEHAPEMTDQLREVIEPDIFMTGDANLLMEAKDKRDPKSDLLTRVMSVLVHIGLIIFLILAPKIFPAHQPTDEEIAMAKRDLNWINTPPRTSEDGSAAFAETSHHAEDAERDFAEDRAAGYSRAAAKPGKAAHRSAGSAEASGCGSAAPAAGPANSDSFRASARRTATPQSTKSSQSPPERRFARKTD